MNERVSVFERGVLHNEATPKTNHRDRKRRFLEAAFGEQARELCPAV